MKNPLGNSEDKGLIPSWGRFPHASEQLSLCDTAIEPVLNSCSSVVAAHGLSSGPPLSPRAAAAEDHVS